MDSLNELAPYLIIGLFLAIAPIVAAYFTMYLNFLQKYYQKIKKWTQVIYLLVKILRFGCVINVEIDELSVGKIKRDDEMIKFGGVAWIELWWCEEINSYQILIRTVEKRPPPVVVDFGEKWRTIVLIPNNKK